MNLLLYTSVFSHSSWIGVLPEQYNRDKRLSRISYITNMNIFGCEYGGIYMIVSPQSYGKKHAESVNRVELWLGSKFYNTYISTNHLSNPISWGMFLLILFALFSAVVAGTHNITVRGSFLCDRNHKLPVFVELMEHDSKFWDNLYSVRVINTASQLSQTTASNGCRQRYWNTSRLQDQKMNTLESSPI